MFCMCLFLFKQKTAYEMRISYLSADVCSSASAGGENAVAVGGNSFAAGPNDTAIGGNARVNADGSTAVGANTVITAGATNAVAIGEGTSVAAASGTAIRSEEHTSELRSLMRISYAVFCLKKKKTN